MGGAWLLHCHIQWHLVVGQTMYFEMSQNADLFDYRVEWLWCSWREEIASLLFLALLMFQLLFLGCRRSPPPNRALQLMHSALSSHFGKRSLFLLPSFHWFRILDMNRTSAIIGIRRGRLAEEAFH